jgi:hypothetical protein
VTRVRSNAKLAFVAAVGAAVGALLARRRRTAAVPSAPSDQRAEELRRKLAEARAAVADENDFEAAGMGAETLVEEPAPTQPPLDHEQPPSPAAGEPEPAPEPEANPKTPAERKEPAAAAEPPPADEFEAMRRRIHEEGRSAAEEMRRSAEKPDQA